MKTILIALLFVGSVFCQVSDEYHQEQMHRYKCEINAINLLVLAGAPPLEAAFKMYWTSCGWEYRDITMDVWCRYYNAIQGRK